MFAGSPDAIGKELRLNGRPYTIVGVMPHDFKFVDSEVRLWTPLAFTPEQKVARHSNNWYNVGRLKSGATIQQAQAQVNALNRANDERFPQWKEILKNAGFHTSVEPLREILIRDVRSSLYLLWGGAVFVLLIGAVNIANLALARFTLRRKEFATRLALGAGRGQITRQVVLENVLVCGVGGLAGVGLGAGLLQSMMAMGLKQLPRVDEVRIDGPVVLVALAMAIGAGILVGLIPLANVFRAKLNDALREDSRTGTTGSGSRTNSPGSGGRADWIRFRPSGGRRTLAGQLSATPARRSWIQHRRRDDGVHRCAAIPLSRRARIARAGESIAGSDPAHSWRYGRGRDIQHSVRRQSQRQRDFRGRLRDEAG